MCLSILSLNIKKNKIKQACLFRELPVETFMVLVAGLDGRLLTPFSLWLGSM